MILSLTLKVKIHFFIYFFVSLSLHTKSDETSSRSRRPPLSPNPHRLFSSLSSSGSRVKMSSNLCLPHTFSQLMKVSVLDCAIYFYCFALAQGNACWRSLSDF